MSVIFAAWWFLKALCKAGITNLNHSPISKVNIFIPLLQIEELSQDVVNVFVKVMWKVRGRTTYSFQSPDSKTIGHIIMAMCKATENTPYMVVVSKIMQISSSKSLQIKVTPVWSFISNNIIYAGGSWSVKENIFAIRNY